jgi:hypothetical protein
MSSATPATRQPPIVEPRPKHPVLMMGGLCRMFHTENGLMHDKRVDGPEERPPSLLRSRSPRDLRRGRSKVISRSSSLYNAPNTSRAASVATTTSTMRSASPRDPREIIRGIGFVHDELLLALGRLDIFRQLPMHIKTPDASVEREMLSGYPVRIDEMDLHDPSMAGMGHLASTLSRLDDPTSF